MLYRVFVDWVTPVGTKRRQTPWPAGGRIFLLLPTRMRGDYQIHREILKRAAEFVGGEDKLAQRLGVRSEDMPEWVQGMGTAPFGVYIMALDMLSRRPQRWQLTRKESPKDERGLGQFAF
jgi:hypothetical protein